MASRPKQPVPRPAPRLYLVTPPLSDPAPFAGPLEAALGAADVAAVLLRLGDADERTLLNCIKSVAVTAQQAGAALVLAGHTELTARGGADGAHMSGADEFLAAVDSLKPDRIAGVGGLASRHDAMSVADGGADYVMFGEPVGGSRPSFAAVEERVGWWAPLFEVPCVAFAASLEEITPLVAAGADFIAIDWLWRDLPGIPAALSQVAAQLRLPEASR